MRLIGLTGRSGCGKTTVGELAREKGFLVLDCDAIYKEITSSPGACLDAIRDTFGAETVCDGKLYRPALREKVFSDPLEMEKLNALTARYMGEEIRSRLANATEAQVLLDAPTLFQSGMDKKCDLIIGVLASDEDCIRRITARDGISAADAARRLAQQPSEEFYKKNCHVCLENRTDPVTFRRQAEQLLASLQKGEL
ncbi:MAG: dephospho-CoA kinase [Clostridia bacterium]|nr:dephospho-CoA kinase [Clostridia bacterium]MBR6553023.1 dephospho-CoA kinase [Clostridia bacterium]